jgi:lipid-binding SYLF domain-containing protein
MVQAPGSVWPLEEAMKHRAKIRWFLVMTMIVTAWQVGGGTAVAGSPAQIDLEARSALQRLYATTPSAAALGEQAKAILVFPSMTKAGFLVGAQFGNGALLRGRQTVGYYNMSAASYGLQAGIQSFGYAMMFMTESAIQYLEQSGGFELGVGPSVVIVDAGMAKSLTTSTAKDDIYGFIFGQQGLMAGLGLQGSKITRFNP